MPPLPASLIQICDLLAHGRSDEDWTDALAGHFSPTLGSEDHVRLARLCLFVAQRALACWELYCEGRGPHESLQRLERWLRSGQWDPADPEREPVHEPMQFGRSIEDCRRADSLAASRAAAFAVRFARTAQLEEAIECLGCANDAFDQSPLHFCDHYWEWLARWAIPAAWENRDLSGEEFLALREPLR